MNRLMIVARLKLGRQEEAERLLEEGPPFEPEELGFERHGAYITAGEVVFVFEGRQVEWIVNDVIDDARISDSFAPWERIIDGSPRIAHERYFWSREQGKLGLGLGT